MQFVTDDPRLDYLVTSGDFQENIEIVQDQENLIPLEMVDYFLKKDGTKPLSFTRIKTQDDAAEWYRNENPDMPEALCDLMARVQFPDTAKPAKEADTTPVFSVTKENTTVTFD